MPIALREKNAIHHSKLHDAERPTILLATTDPLIRSHLTNLLQSLPINTIQSKAVGAAKILLATKRVTACLCGFWLQDGTYRELVSYVRRERIEIPVIIVSAPNGSTECQDYLAAANIGALDYLPYPYRKSNLERMLGLNSLSPNEEAEYGSAIAVPALDPYTAV